MNALASAPGCKSAPSQATKSLAGREEEDDDEESVGMETLVRRLFSLIATPYFSIS
jgi:hypothetical protein